MTPVRIVATLVAIATAALAFHLPGARLWEAEAVGLGLAAGLSAYALWQDGQLGEVLMPKGLDISTGVLASTVLYLAIYLVFVLVITPTSDASGLMRKCTLQGPLLPRLDPHGLAVFYETIRGEVCRDYGRTLGLVGPWRGVAVVVLGVLEEIAWRGGVQQGLSEKLGSTRGWLTASVLYGVAHLATGSVMLALLALVGGTLWGALYRFRGRLAPAVFSHAVFTYFLFHAQPLVAFM